jgi:hypothetical protein
MVDDSDSLTVKSIPVMFPACNKPMVPSVVTVPMMVSGCKPGYAVRFTSNTVAWAGPPNMLEPSSNDERQSRFNAREVAPAARRRTDDNK